jgi:hypothetical protein
MSAPEQCTHKRFRSSWYTKIVGYVATAFIFVSATAIYAHNWAVSIICFVGAFGLSSFEMSGLAADYAKWRQSIEQATSEPDKTGD